MRSVIDTLDLTVDEIYKLMETAQDIGENPEKYSDKCRGKKLATLFFEPSTRTRLSFESAMYELGGNVLSVSGSNASSAAKGESIADTAKTVSNYADVIAIRHYMEGSALVSARNSSVPVINAGDGGHCHPTQTLADLLTIYTEKGGFDNLRVGLCGDLKYGRTVHSLIAALSRYSGIEFVLISPDELKLPDYVKTEIIEKNNMKFWETNSLEDALPQLDILYMTRIQRERFDSPDEYERLKDSYILTEEKMKLAGENCIVMHPLPRVNEISVAVDKDKRACYFKQVKNGKLMRMALILKLLFDNNECTSEKYIKGFECTNPRCVSSSEPELEQLFKESSNSNVLRCAYCESEVKKDE